MPFRRVGQMRRRGRHHAALKKTAQSELTHDGPLIVIQKRRRRLLVGRVAVVVVGPDT